MEKINLLKTILLLLLLAVLGFTLALFTGCSKAIAIEQNIADEITAFDEKTHGILGIITKTGQTLHYVSELHKAGVDTDIINAIHEAIDEAHAIAKREHFKLKKE